ncbi:kinesin-like protein KIN-UB [Camellia sinensis]|uniref:kinesin-like protein KIN-UB n=1 Tax=Camellia sinensis TaxID=4442 RepID=UPI0010357215|nr:kinesin-like protein KIN-UB [Camellia sinensis]
MGPQGIGAIEVFIGEKSTCAKWACAKWVLEGGIKKKTRKKTILHYSALISLLSLSLSRAQSSLCLSRSGNNSIVGNVQTVCSNSDGDFLTGSPSSIQLYMETTQDLLNPAIDNISIMEDPKTGDVSLPRATVVEIRGHRSFIELL